MEFELPRAILFDMDGTLTEPFLDYPRIKAEMGIGPGPILEALEKLDPELRTAAQVVLHRHEEIAARESTLNEGCFDLLKMLERMNIATALVTRNTRQSVKTVFERH